MSNENAAAGKVVTIHYTLTNDAGNVVDTSSGRDPLTYLHGGGNIIPGLEKQIEGRSAGESFTADIPPEEGYGPKQGTGPQEFPKSAFPEGTDVQPGMQFAAQGPDGSLTHLWVTDVQGDKVWLDVNHPLAGETLHFKVDVVEVRDATGEEQEHGHVHGPHGHDH